MSFRWRVWWICLYLADLWLAGSMGEHAVARAAGGFIRGVVTDVESGEPITGLRVRIYDSAWTFRVSDSAWTDELGEYITGELAAGEYYIRAVSTYPQPWVTQFWYRTPDQETAVPIRVEAGQTIIGIDFAMARGGYLRGGIQDTNGYPMVDVDLDVYTHEWRYAGIYTDRTDADGQYTIGPLPAGQWYVRADPDLVHGVCQAYWPGVWYRNAAQILAVGAGDDIPGVDFSLVSGGMMTGRVMEKVTGQPKVDCRIRIDGTDGLEQPIHTVKTQPDGTYLAYGLPNGVYRILADAPHGCGAQDAYHPNAPAAADAAWVTTTAGDTVTGIDIELPEGNFDLNIALKMPRRWVDPGEVFGLTMDVENDGTELTALPVFLLLDIHGAIYFWPSWSLWDPPEFIGLDFLAVDLPPGSSSITILPEFIWPQLGFDMDNLFFIGAMTSWSLAIQASDVEMEEWSFDGYP
ncbi:carboxypeptidase regulatory-like domain-containing protein [bacterium]|nr:carboxypeptidase regulatory-like domain-containing protein [candidate division CSSED10-310 bacterium]